MKLSQMRRMLDWVDHKYSLAGRSPEQRENVLASISNIAGAICIRELNLSIYRCGICGGSHPTADHAEAVYGVKGGDHV